MIEWIYLLKDFGSYVTDVLWFPVLMWTVVGGLAFALLKFSNNLSPLYRYHLNTAVLYALPAGLLSAVALHVLRSNAPVESTGGAFIIVTNPIQQAAVNPVTSINESFFTAALWYDFSFIIGILTVLVGVVSIILVFRYAVSLFQLYTLRNNLQVFSHPEIHPALKHKLDENSVSLLFQNHYLVPFTFGWKNPVIILPELLKSDQEKMEMAIEHELVHIERKDYGVQLMVNFILQVFWFHPLAYLTNREIDIYREISCDQEVLRSERYSMKSYATLLYELLPLDSHRRYKAVGMAVKKSTLRKRLSIMNKHSFKHSSLKSSFVLLVVMLLGITLPIACSDMRGFDQVDPSELEKETLDLTGLNMSVNGIEVFDLPDKTEIKFPALNAILINAKEYGYFKIAFQPFEGSKKVGVAENNSIKFLLNEMEIKITSNQSIFNNVEQSSVWAQHSKLEISNWIITSVALDKPMHIIPELSVSWDSTSENNILFPPPPPPTSISGKGTQPTFNNEEVFIVVEEMPRLIGGQAALQNRVEYPEMARKAGIEGRVTVQFVVDKNGDVQDARVVRGIGGGCDEAALEAVRAAKFEPGQQRGRNVHVQYALNINFTLSDSTF